MTLYYIDYYIFLSYYSDASYCIQNNYFSKTTNVAGILIVY